MEPPVLNKPKVNITPKITKISNLAQSAEEIRRTSTKLRKTFESGTYQKKTQLTVLNRYKRRLDSIQKQNDNKFTKKQRVKIKLPEVKKYAGSLFTAASASDPLKTIGALAAFNALRKGAKGDILGALGPALVASGIFFGPSLINRGAGLLKSKGSPQKSPQIGAAGASAGSFWGTPYAETKAGKAYGSMRQFRNMPKWAQKLSSSSAGRFAASNERMIQGTANIGDRLRVGTRGMGMQGVGGVAEGVATSRPSISPRVGLLNAALFGLDYMGRKGEGQTNLQSGIGAGAGLGGALLGAAIGSALFPGVGTVAGFLIGAAFSTGGAMLGSTIADKLTGVDRLKKQTEQQKKLIEKKQDKTLTFGKSLDRYERVVNKFEEFSKAFTGFDDHRAKSTYVEGTEPSPPPPPPGQNIVADTQVVQDAIDFRRQFPLGGGTPDKSMTPYELQLRENTMLYDSGIGNDPTVERVHTQGSAHYSNRAIDIPVNSKDLGDRVAQFWRSKGYYVIWQAPGHYDHVHVQWNAGSPQESSISPQTSQQSLSPVFQRPQQTPQGLSIGAGGFNVGGRPAAQVSSPSRPSRPIEYYPSYDPRGQMEQVIPVPILIQQQQMMQGGSAESMILPGPSEQDLLNSFYKRVLLNTVA